MKSEEADGNLFNELEWLDDRTKTRTATVRKLPRVTKDRKACRQLHVRI